MPRIALIHAVMVAVQPVQQAFAALWPEAEAVNLLDDSLSEDRAKSPDVTPEIDSRIANLGRYALNLGADGILFTCSAFGPSIEAFAAETRIPVLKPNEAMFDEALRKGARVGMLATFGPSVASMEAEFNERARAAGRAASIRTVLVDGAMAALQSGDAATHNRLLGDAAPQLAGSDAVMLAQFSTSHAFDAVSQRLECPVLTSPRSAVMALQERLA